MKREYTSSGATLGFDETMAHITSIRTCAASVQLSINPASRISKFEQQLRRFGKFKKSELAQADFDWDSFTEGNRDVTEVEFICRELAEEFPTELKNMLKEYLLGGATLPSLESDTRPRDYQFELYMAALFSHSGFSISLAEPDVLFEHGIVRYGIAAKRISSEKQIEKRVGAAVKQLEKSDLHGFVALSVDRLVPGLNPRVVATSPEALDSAGATLVMDVMRKHGPLISRHLLHPNVLGLIVNLVMPAFMAGTAGHIGTTSAFRIMPRPDETAESMEISILINSKIKAPSRL